MQNRYVGDIGDFGKYGLLRHLFNTDLKLGINWYLVPDEIHNKDGSLISYLLDENKNHEKFRDCDKYLYDKLKEIVKPKRTGKKVISTSSRDVKLIEKSNLFKNVIFYNKYLEFSNTTRDGWMQESFAKLKICDVIFFDPDNGLQVKSVGPYSKKSIKYLFLKELVPFWKCKKSLIIYQHSHFGESVRKQIVKKCSQLNSYLDDCASSFTLRYHRGTSRFFVIVPAKGFRNEILNRARSFVSGAWGQHFDIVE